MPDLEEQFVSAIERCGQIKEQAAKAYPGADDQLEMVFGDLDLAADPVQDLLADLKDAGDKAGSGE